MSTSEPRPLSTDFDRWIVEEFARSGAFTCFVVLVDISETTVTPLCSTYFNVIGDEVDWNDIVVMFAGSGAEWAGASFFPAAGGPMDNPTARLRLRELEAHVDGDRLVLNQGHFFDKWGRSLKVDEVELQ